MNQNEHLRTVLLQQLESLQAAGVQTVPKGYGKLTVMPAANPDAPVPQMGAHAQPVQAHEESADLTSSSAVDIAAQVGQVAEPKADLASASPTQTPPASTATPEERGSALKVIQSEVENCTACDDLCTNRNKTVFGVGDPNARLVFVGEGPGAEEDRIGEPFVGAAGQLLDKILKACSLSREEVYILNTVKCRPPSNRNPTETELANCWPFGIRQLEIIQPEFICCLGSVAAKTVLKTQKSIGKLRGEFHQFGESKVVVTYHPAYLLRTPSAKKHTWNDMKMLMSEMGNPI